MNEGENNQPDEPAGLEVPSYQEGKRRHIQSTRMQEYLRQKDQALPQKVRKCPYKGCGKQFSSAPGLRYHVFTHSPDMRNFRCERCKKTFKSQNGLKYHSQRNKCPQSAVKTFSDQVQQQQHISVILPVPSIPEQGHALERSGEETVPLTAILPRVDTSSSNVQSRIRKMESRRKEMLMELHSKSHLPPVQATQPSQTPQQKGPVNLELKSETGRLVESSDERLQEFASIAIGPQSPLLQNSAIDWDHARLTSSRDSRSVQLIPVRPSPGQRCADDKDRPDPCPSPPSLAGFTSPSSNPFPFVTRSEHNQQYSTAVIVLSDMARNRSRESSGGQQLSVAPKAKRPMNAFLLWAQTKRQEYILKNPNTNNRNISSMLSKEWERLEWQTKEYWRSIAKEKADIQKKQHPDCWKRKK